VSHVKKIIRLEWMAISMVAARLVYHIFPLKIKRVLYAEVYSRTKFPNTVGWTEIVIKLSFSHLTIIERSQEIKDSNISGNQRVIPTIAAQKRPIKPFGWVYFPLVSIEDGISERLAIGELRANSWTDAWWRVGHTKQSKIKLA
jgi:hypothetical protein